MNFRGSIARPVLSPVNALAHPLRHAPDALRSAWFATPSLCDSFIHYAMPVSRRFRLFSIRPAGAPRVSPRAGVFLPPERNGGEELQHHCEMPAFFPWHDVCVRGKNLAPT